MPYSGPCSGGYGVVFTEDQLEADDEAPGQTLLTTDSGGGQQGQCLQWISTLQLEPQLLQEFGRSWLCAELSSLPG